VPQRVAALEKDLLLLLLLLLQASLLLTWLELLTMLYL
jgi:hypothetical protein